MVRLEKYPAGKIKEQTINMTSIRRLIATSCLGMAVFVASASAATITRTFSVFGDIPNFAAPSSNSTSAATFDKTEVDAYILATLCTPGFSCSGATLTQIDFTISAQLSSSLQLLNTTGSTQYVGAMAGQGGTFSGGATSGFAVASLSTLSLIDPLANDLVFTSPKFLIATNTRRRASCGSGTPSSGNFSNCLAVANGTSTYSGTGALSTSTGTLTGAGLAAALSTYQTFGAGSVTFDLDLAAGEDHGNLPSGVTITINNAQVLARTDGLQVAYTYTYQEVEASTIPEPTSILLFGSGLLLAGVIRKRARQ